MAEQKNSRQAAANQPPTQVGASNYLSWLKFPPALKDSLAGRYLSNLRLMIMLLAVVIIGGVFSLVTLPQTLFPEVKIPIVVVSTVFPGATPDDVENLVTIPLEKEIKSVKNVDHYSSSSNDNVSVIQVEFSDQVTPEEARSDVQAAVDKVTNLPADAQTPSVKELDFENIAVIEAVLFKTKDFEDQASLMQTAENLREQITDLKTVDQVSFNGLVEQEVRIQLSLETIESKKLNPLTVTAAVAQALSAYPAGQVVTNQANYFVTIEKPATSLAQLRQLNITLGDDNYLLADLATISWQPSPDQAQSYYGSNQEETRPAVSLAVYKTSPADVGEAGQEITEFLTNFQKQIGPDYQLKIVNNYAQLINDQFSDLWDNFVQTLALVFLSMLLLYGIRQALIAAGAVPLSLLIVFIAMKMFGISLSFVSIYSLLIALGLFVDNAVVIIEGFTSYHLTGKFSSWQTAVLVWRDYALELFSINLLTIWAFLPLLVTSGIIGEFIYPIPVVVSAAMMGSVLIALLFTLPSMMLITHFQIPNRVKVLLVVAGLLLAAGLSWWLIPDSAFKLVTWLVMWLVGGLIYFQREYFHQLFSQKVFQRPKIQKIGQFLSRAFNSGFISLEEVSQKYRQIISYLLATKSARLKTIAVIVVFSLFSYALLPLGLVVNEFFPKTDEEHLYVSLELPVGTKASLTSQLTKELLNELRQEANVESVVADEQKGYSAYVTAGGANTHQALFDLSLGKAESRTETSMEIADRLRQKYPSFKTATVKVNEESSGPPAGSDLEVSILNDDLNQLAITANQVQDFLANLPGTSNVENSMKDGESKLVFSPDSGQLAKYQISAETIGYWLRVFVSGLEFEQWSVGSLDYDVALRVGGDDLAIEQLSALKIPTASGYVPLTELGQFQLAAKRGSISRYDGQRRATVTAAALPGYLPTQLYTQLENYLNQDLQLQSGSEWQAGGMNEENQKSITSIVQAMAISAILILATMVIQLKSFRQATIVMLVIPLAASGVFVMFALTGTPLSFPALIGMLSLFGIVIANSLMIVDKVNQNLSAGLSNQAAIIDAAASRLEPILLTSVSQVIGLIPITLSDPMWRGMGGAIISGMLFSGVTMLFFVPIVYFYFFPQVAKR